MKIKTKRYYVYYLLKVVGALIALLPLKAGLYIGALIGRLIFTFAKKERHVAFENLKASFPKKTENEIEEITKEVFANLGRNFVEWINMHYKLSEKNIDKWVKAEGLEKVDRALSKGKGAIILTSHLGNWELVGIYFLLKGYAGGVIVRRIYFERYNDFVNALRTKKGAVIVYRDESPKKALRLLRDNKILGILADQDMDSVDGVFVNFFGRPAYTPKAPVAFALASGAPIIPCFMIREKEGHRFVIEDPIELQDKIDKEETIKHNTEAWSRVVESYIRKYPDEWVWMHKRWKTKPRSQKAHV